MFFLVISICVKCVSYFFLSEYKSCLACAASLSLQSWVKSCTLFLDKVHNFSGRRGMRKNKEGLGCRNYGIRIFFEFNMLNRRRENCFAIKFPCKRKANKNCFNLPHTIFAYFVLQLCKQERFNPACKHVFINAS